ncbi:MAG TPA: hypothetical protein VM142_09690 [Acidimicrobiales bacterium]|nr:hypothetical protein [Acidimicrobiales bacterium]
MEGWLSSLETVQGRRPSTMASNRRNLEHHVLPRLGGVRLQDLGAEHLNRLYAQLRTTGNR